MPNFMDTLFGSDPELQVETRTTMTPEQQALMRVLIGQLGGVGGGGPATGWSGGDRASLARFAQGGGVGGMGGPEGTLDIAGGNFLSGMENTSLAALEERAMARATGGMEGAGNEALMELIQNRGGVGGFEDFFQSNVQDPALRDFTEKIKPAIGRSFGGSSFFSSERATQDKNASNELITSLTKARADLSLQDRNASAQRLLQAIGLGSQVDATNTDTLIKELGAFGTERGARNERINQLLALLQMRGIENLGAGLPGTTGLAQSFVGGLGSGIGAGLGKP
jgi:hypothetical protein